MNKNTTFPLLRLSLAILFDILETVPALIHDHWKVTLCLLIPSFSHLLNGNYNNVCLIGGLVVLNELMHVKCEST